MCESTRCARQPSETGEGGDICEPESSGSLYGEEAAAYGRALLMEATGADNVDDAVRVALRDEVLNADIDPTT